MEPLDGSLKVADKIYGLLKHSRFLQLWREEIREGERGVCSYHSLNRPLKIVGRRVGANLLVVFAVFGDHFSEDSNTIIDAGAVLLFYKVVNLPLFRVLWGRTRWGLLCTHTHTHTQFIKVTH